MCSYMQKGAHLGFLAAGEQRGLVDDICQLSAAEAASDLRQRPTRTPPVQLRRLEGIDIVADTSKDSIQCNMHVGVCRYKSGNAHQCL